MARPRQFEPDAALAAIKDAFWRRGYEGTSMQDIEVATGLKKQSLYRLYGDKRGMYLKALEHYGANEVEDGLGLLAAQGAPRERFGRLFSSVVDAAVSGDRRGCFLCNASIDQAQVNEETSLSVADCMERIRMAFDGALVADDAYQADSDRRAKKAASLLAFYLGLRVMVRAGVNEATLNHAVEDALEGI